MKLSLKKHLRGIKSGRKCIGMTTNNENQARNFLRAYGITDTLTVELYWKGQTQIQNSNEQYVASVKSTTAWQGREVDIQIASGFSSIEQAKAWARRRGLNWAIRE